MSHGCSEVERDVRVIPIPNTSRLKGVSKAFNRATCSGCRDCDIPPRARGAANLARASEKTAILQCGLQEGKKAMRPKLRG